MDIKDKRIKNFNFPKKFNLKPKKRNLEIYLNMLKNLKQMLL